MKFDEAKEILKQVSKDGKKLLIYYSIGMFSKEINSISNKKLTPHMICSIASEMYIMASEDKPDIQKLLKYLYNICSLSRLIQIVKSAQIREDNYKFSKEEVIMACVGYTLGIHARNTNLVGTLYTKLDLELYNKTSMFNSRDCSDNLTMGVLTILKSGCIDLFIKTENINIPGELINNDKFCTDVKNRILDILDTGESSVFSNEGTKIVGPLFYKSTIDYVNRC